MKIYTVSTAPGGYKVRVTRQKAHCHIKNREYFCDERRAQLFVDAIDNPRIDLVYGQMEVWGATPETRTRRIEDENYSGNYPQSFVRALYLG